MRWKRGRGRQYIEDRRGRGGFGGLGRGGGGFGGGLPIPMGVGGGGCGGVVLVIILILLFTGGGGLFGGGGGGLGVDPNLQPFPQSPDAGSGETLAGADADAKLVDFMGYLSEDIQDSWARSFTEAGQRYQTTKTVLFTNATSTGCGSASSATGPFYCPADRKVYLDLSFFRELRSRFGAPGDFAQAYVIAHEYGHHVQNLLGIMDDVRRGQQENPDEANELSIRLELQADCFAGVWGYTAVDELEEGDVEEAIAAASAVGDDRIQEQATGRIDRESWTHGSSEQRARWFKRGFESGDPNSCDAFEGDV